MSIAVRFNPTSLTADKYDQLSGSSRRPAHGLRPDSSITFASDRTGTCALTKSGNSREQFEAFGERLMPVLSEAGIEFSGEPEIFEVHNITKR